MESRRGTFWTGLGVIVAATAVAVTWILQANSQRHEDRVNELTRLLNMSDDLVRSAFKNASDEGLLTVSRFDCVYASRRGDVNVQALNEKASAFFKDFVVSRSELNAAESRLCTSYPDLAEPVKNYESTIDDMLQYDPGAKSRDAAMRDFYLLGEKKASGFRDLMARITLERKRVLEGD